MCRLLPTALALGLACDAGGDDGDDELPRCVEIDAAGCAPLYTPNFDEVFANTLMPDCASGGGACHGTAEALGAAANGLHFDDADASFARLLAEQGDDSFVVAGDAACSRIIVRLRVEGDARMPPGTSLADGEICSVAQWIAQGAAR